MTQGTFKIDRNTGSERGTVGILGKGSRASH